MKKMFILFLTVGMLLGVTLSAQAAIITITFDEPGIDLEEVIEDQYASSGINWIIYEIELGVENTNRVVSGTLDYFNNVFPTDGQILQYNNRDAPAGVIELDFLSDYLSFGYRRPSSSGEIFVEVLNSGTSVYATSFVWDSGVWDTFIYDGSLGDFNQITMSSSNKFIIDNLEVNPVPIPSAFVLLASGLLMLIRRRRMN